MLIKLIISDEEALQRLGNLTLVKLPDGPEAQGGEGITV
jgi:hypothetical protein